MLPYIDCLSQAISSSLHLHHLWKGSLWDQCRTQFQVPAVAWEALWWNKLQLDVQIQPGETIWDLVEDETDNIPIDDLEVSIK
eukprot:788201-Amphidinium_carterae.1